VKGARTHNLKNIDVRIPRGRLTVVTGLSGSGKSSLAFDTIYAEGQRRYVESLSAYAKQFLDQMEKPDVDRIEGLSPAISIDQKTTSRNPRSTVGTITEIYDYLRLLWARAGMPHCYRCRRPVARQEPDQIIERLSHQPNGTRLWILAPVVRGKKGEHKRLFERLAKTGYVKARMDGEVRSLDSEIRLKKTRKHTIEVVVDRLRLGPGSERRLARSVEAALRLAEGLVLVEVDGREEILFSTEFSCPHCEISMGEISPRLFSFNSPYGACETCSGLGTHLDVSESLVVPDPDLSLREGAVAPLGPLRSGWQRRVLEALAEERGFDLDRPFGGLSEESRRVVLYGSEDRRVTVRYDFEAGEGEFTLEHEGVIPNLRRRYRQTRSEKVRRWIEGFMEATACRACSGTRLRPEALAVTVGDLDIARACALDVAEAIPFFAGLQLDPYHESIARRILREIVQRLEFLSEVGLSYLTLDRSAVTLSGGEAQRIRLAAQIGSRLRGVLYILDEPSVGLHQRDNRRLLSSLQRLRDGGNTVIVIEHDRDTILSADYVVDLGPGAGEEGGHLVAAGEPREIAGNPRSLTGRYLVDEKRVYRRNGKRRSRNGSLRVEGARQHNLKNLNVEIPLGTFTCVTGVSGSGKSTLVNDVLFRALQRHFYRSRRTPGKHRRLVGVEAIDKVIEIDQSPIGRTPRSNPATYTGLFTPVRNLFSMLPEARVRGYEPGRFSFNVRGGRCEACEGDGLVKVEMHFLPDVYVHCQVCRGRRYNRETLEVTYRGHSIAEVLDLSVDEALRLFENHPAIERRLGTLQSVGLGYIRLGQSATTLSGGEAQRVKLAAELSKKSTGSTLYILDEPTTGLHFEDVAMLLDVLHRLVDRGNTVLVIEHNPDVILTADHIIDLGPEGGEGGGELVFSGPPGKLASFEGSHTGQVLGRYL
jgi:excinuclease ABC subunit A